MREDDHSRKFKNLMPELDTFFRAGMKGYVARVDKAVVSDDLVQLTGIFSGQYWKQPEYKKRYEKVEILIWVVAKSVLYQFQNPAKKQKEVTSIGPKELSTSANSDPLQAITAREDLMRLRAFAQDDETLWAIARRDEGVDDCEIARELGISEPTLRKRISRLLEKITSKWPNRCAM